MVDMTTDDKLCVFFHMCRFMYHVFLSTDLVAQNFKTPKVPISQGTKGWSLPIFCASEVCGVRNQLFRKNRHMVAILKVEKKLEHLRISRNGWTLWETRSSQKSFLLNAVMLFHCEIDEIWCWLESWSSILGQLEWEQWLWDYETGVITQSWPVGGQGPVLVFHEVTNDMYMLRIHTLYTHENSVKRSSMRNMCPKNNTAPNF